MRLCVPLILTGLLSGLLWAAPPARSNEPPAETLRFGDGTMTGWIPDTPRTWGLQATPVRRAPDEATTLPMLTSLAGGEQATGRIRSPRFTITSPLQRFLIAGADGTASGTNDGNRNRLLLRAAEDDAILREMRPPGTHLPMPGEWFTGDLLNRSVYLEMIDDNPRLRADGFAWIGLADYQQFDLALEHPEVRNDLASVRIDEAAQPALCRSLPFLAAAPETRGATQRRHEDDAEVIPVHARAEVVYLLGMINEGWDHGVAHWGEHPELREPRNDQLWVGAPIGELEIRYTGGVTDSIPLVIGTTAWFVQGWANGPSHGYAQPVQEPFASRPELMQILRTALRLKEDPRPASPQQRTMHYYLPVKARPLVIESIAVRDNPAFRGVPAIAGITLAGAEPAANLKAWPGWTAERDDLPPTLDGAARPDWEAQLDALTAALYTSEADLPQTVEPVEFPAGFDASRIRFLGDARADMLSNLWTANLMQMAEKFEPETGFFHESGKATPWYGGYSGVGTWAPAGIYYGGAYSRCSDHFATLVLRHVHQPQRLTSYVDFVDHWLYYFRNNHDPAQGPENAALEVDRYPADAPPHWTFVVNGPSAPWPINELPGAEETDGHGATIVGRWVAWRALGSPAGEWMTQPREEVFGKSRWESTRDSAEFLCWLLDYTGRDVMYCEGETTGWAALNTPNQLIPDGMAAQTDPIQIRANYANANMYEVYPTWVCAVALRCAAEMAVARQQTELATRWEGYAARLEEGMDRLLRVGDHNRPMWRVSPMSVYPSLQDSLVQAWFAIYRDGYDPQRWNERMTTVTRNTLARQLDQPYGHAPVLAMGYGQGWLTKSALLLDEMDDAGPLLWNIAKYSYDKNMNYVDAGRGIDWRPWQWIIPEGTNILPNGRWHRIGDLSNGANQGPAMHALEVCAGVDDTDPAHLRIMPRVPDFLEGIAVENFLTLVPEGNGTAQARLQYRYGRSKRFTLKSDRPLPRLAVRLGPWPGRVAAEAAVAPARLPAGATVRVEASGHERQQPAWWVWIEGLTGVETLDIPLTQSVP